MEALDIPFETQLAEACKMKDLSGLMHILRSVNEDQMLKFALQAKRHIVLEEVVKYLVVCLSHNILSEPSLLEKFLGFVSRYKLINTKVEEWVNLYLNSKKISSHVQDYQCKSVAGAAEILPLGKVPEESKNEWIIRKSKSEVGQAVADKEGKILWADHYAAWLWERMHKDLVGKNFFELLSDSSQSFCEAKYGEIFFNPGEACKTMSYSIKRGFECRQMDACLSERPKVLTSQFTRVILYTKNSDDAQHAIHIKVRPSSKKTYEKFTAFCKVSPQ